MHAYYFQAARAAGDAVSRVPAPSDLEMYMLDSSGARQLPCQFDYHTRRLRRRTHLNRSSS